MIGVAAGALGLAGGVVVGVDGCEVGDGHPAGADAGTTQTTWLAPVRAVVIETTPADLSKVDVTVPGASSDSTFQPWG